MLLIAYDAYSDRGILLYDYRGACMGTIFVHRHELHFVCSNGNVLNYMQNDWNNIIIFTDCLKCIYGYCQK